MHCPNCQSKLHNVVAQTRHGTKVILDQCSVCGGLWCDNLEMYRVGPKSAQKIDLLDIDKLHDIKPIKDKMLCPKCNVALIEFKDPYFPQQIKLDHCSECGGFWLNRGELAEFKEWQKAKNDSSKKEVSQEDKKLKYQIAAYMMNSGDQSYETIGKVGRFLSGSKYSHPIMDPEIEREINDFVQLVAGLIRGDAASMAVYIIYSIVQSLYDIFLDE